MRFLVLVLANDILLDSIAMEEDTPWSHENQRLPILDTKMVIGNNQIIHRYYRKPMASLELILLKTAMSMPYMINILTQDGARR